MKKKTVIILAAAAAVLCVLYALINSLLFRTISKKKINAFLEDSKGAVVYLAASDAPVDDSELQLLTAAAVYAANTGDGLIVDNGALIIPEEELENELSALFLDHEPAELVDSMLISREDNGDYRFLPVDGEAVPDYEITDAFYGYVGSEPTTVTVHYTLGEFSCQIEYTLAGEKGTPYSFVITDIRTTDEATAQGE